MGAIERASFAIKCKCGATGVANWQENDGYQFATRGPQTAVKVSPGFEWIKRVPDGPGSFFGRKLVCRACGRIPAITETREGTPAPQAPLANTGHGRAGSLKLSATRKGK